MKMVRILLTYFNISSVSINALTKGDHVWFRQTPVYKVKYIFEQWVMRRLQNIVYFFKY